MILVCPNRFASGVEPLILNRGGVCTVYALDGSGSWGFGNEAAAWFRNWIATESDNLIASPDTITHLLAAGIRELPSEITDCEFGWSFSIAVAICKDKNVQVGACGSIAAVRVGSKRCDRIFVPKRLVNDLVSHGIISQADAENHQLRRVISGPFFGVDNCPELHWSTPITLNDGERIVLADAALPHLIEKFDFSFETAPELRDSIENYGGSNTSTVIIDNCANARGQLDQPSLVTQSVDVFMQRPP